MGFGFDGSIFPSSLVCHFYCVIKYQNVSSNLGFLPFFIYIRPPIDTFLVILFAFKLYLLFEIIYLKNAILPKRYRNTIFLI